MKLEECALSRKWIQEKLDEARGRHERISVNDDPTGKIRFEFKAPLSLLLKICESEMT